MNEKKSKAHLIMSDLLKGEKQIDIANNHNVSQSYISVINRRLLQLKYRPYILNGEICCLECNQKDNLVIHRNHDTGQPIAILCRSCNRKVGNKTYFKDAILTESDYDVEESSYGKEGITIKITNQLAEDIVNYWNKTHKQQFKHPTKVINRILYDILDNHKEYNNKFDFDYEFDKKIMEE